MAFYLHPDPRGYDTHTQLGLPACGFLQITGLPCASCGMTTAFANMAHGHFVGALRAQAFGAALFLLTALAAVLGTGQLVLGRYCLRPMRPATWWISAAPAGWWSAGR